MTTTSKTPKPKPTTTTAPKPKRITSTSELEADLAFQIFAAGLPLPEQEYEFAKAAIGRKWRADFCWPQHMLIVEVEGGTWSGGRHTSGAGFREDCIKYAEAVLLGYSVIRVTGDMVTSGQALGYVQRALEARWAAA